MSDSIKKWEEINEQKFDPELNQIFPGYYTTTTQPETKKFKEIEEKQTLPNSQTILNEIRNELLKCSLSDNTLLGRIKVDEYNNYYFNIHLNNINKIFKIFTIEEYNG